MERLVLGGGLAGLVYAFYNKDFKVLTDRIGGQSSGAFVLGPRIIQKHDATFDLLTKLGYKNFVWEEDYNFCIHDKPMFIKRARIGYYEDDKVVSEPSKVFKKKYYMKSRCLKYVADIPDSVMSEDKQFIDYYAISHEKLASLIAKQLISENRLFVARVDQVELQENLLHVFADGKVKTLQYERLVNTAPFPMFFKMCNPGRELQDAAFSYEPKFFISADKYDFQKYVRFENIVDYIYFAGEEPFHRITVGKSEVVVECTGKKMYEKFHDQFKHLQWSVQELKVGQIKHNYCSVKMEIDGIEVSNVRNFGRYAQWDHSIKTQQCVEMAQKGLWE